MLILFHRRLSSFRTCPGPSTKCERTRLATFYLVKLTQSTTNTKGGRRGTRRGDASTETRRQVSTTAKCTNVRPTTVAKALRNSRTIPTRARAPAPNANRATEATQPICQAAARDEATSAAPVRVIVASSRTSTSTCRCLRSVFSHTLCEDPCFLVRHR